MKRFMKNSNRLVALLVIVGLYCLGKNGHGVKQFTESKVKLVEWLYDEHGFDVVVFESGFFECGHVWDRIKTLTSEDALFQCLRYPFQHAELVPLFDLIRQKQESDRPLVLAGMDFQAQGFDSEIRPAVLHDLLGAADMKLADEIATLDTTLFLPESAGGLGDDVYQWAYENSDSIKALYLSAAETTRGWEKWAFFLATGWVDRLAARGKAELEGAEERPAKYYELRDEWMARAVSAHADSITGAHKVAVWLHNEHAGYGQFSAGLTYCALNR